MLYSLFKSRDCGLLQLSEEGIYLAHLGTILPWRDIGPAWVSVTNTNGFGIKDVLFVLRNSSTHQKRMSKVGKLLIGMSRVLSHSKTYGKTDWGFTSLLLAFNADLSTLGQMNAQMKMIREKVLADPSATTFNIAIPFRVGISAEDLVGIINAEIAARDERFYFGRWRP